MKTLLAIAALLGLSGCMAIAPNTIRPELEHISHLTQHQPCTTDPTHYGANVASIVAHWDIPKTRVTFELAEGIDLDRHWTYGKDSGDGEILGPREQFAVRIGYTFQVKP